MSLKYALFTAEFVAEAIPKCAIHKRLLSFGFATCALATLASRLMIRRSIYSATLWSELGVDKPTGNTLSARRLFGLAADPPLAIRINVVQTGCNRSVLK
jgi:hypothetical protein